MTKVESEQGVTETEGRAGGRGESWPPTVPPLGRRGELQIKNTADKRQRRRGTGNHRKEATEGTQLPAHTEGPQTTGFQPIEKPPDKDSRKYKSVGITKLNISLVQTGL